MHAYQLWGIGEKETGKTEDRKEDLRFYEEINRVLPEDMWPSDVLGDLDAEKGREIDSRMYYWQETDHVAMNGRRTGKFE